MATVSHPISSGLLRPHARFMALLIASALVFFIQPVTCLSSGIVLNDFVQHYEPLFYDEKDVHHQLKRSKRESDADVLFFRFNAHNRLFQIRLRRSANEVFADDIQIESSTGPIYYNRDNIYEGHMEDDDQSSVSAVVTSAGHLDATISTASETYYVEPSSRYFDGGNLSFPGVIYKASDVIHPHRHGDHQCASHHFYLKQFEHARNCAKTQTQTQTQTQTYSPNQTNQSYPPVIHPCQHDNIPDERDKRGGHGKEKDTIDRTMYSGWQRHPHDRKTKKKRRRALTVDQRKTTCMLYLQADHLFYGKLGSEEACIESMTRHVQRVNAIYKDVDFDGDGRGDNINFMIKRIKVHTEQALNDPSYRFPGNYGVEKFLEIFSEEDYNSFCLAYMFTYRDFEGGTLGLAWTGDLKNAGGVCEKNGHYRGSLKSLNTGIVTLLNYGKHVPPAVSHVTLAHEIGHNFGSPHDPENNADCTPSGADGNYIMFARATSGDKKNNNQFSPCSLKSINSVLGFKARSETGCFTEPQNAICGNGVVETGEECDCGWEEDCKEKCCYPMRTHPLPYEKPCTLRPFKKCSPSQGPCCTDECQLRYGGKCRGDNGCRDSAYCDGSGPKCPASNNKPNKTVCNEEFVCFMGECTGSICIAYGLQSCQCQVGPDDPPTKHCELCCKLPGEDQPCVSSFDWNESPYDVPDMHFKAGTPCNNYNGYCDVFQRCREVDPSGPLATLRRLLLSDESIASLKRWVVEHWYLLLFIVAAFVTVIVAVARLFGKRVQKMRRHRSRTTRVTTNNNNGTATAAGAGAAGATTTPTTVQTEDGQQHTVHPVAVRTKIPLKRKVRENKKTKKPTATPSSKKNATTNSSSAAANLKNLVVFRKTKRQHASRAKDSSADRPRRTHMGASNTKEKVRSWLERENPTHTKFDSDQESHFPDEQDEESNTNRESEPDAQFNSATNVAFHASNDHLQVDPSAFCNKTNVKMMRSISENHNGTAAMIGSHGRTRFSRSISHGHETDFGRLSRKTESHSHLLSKSELELDIKSATNIESALHEQPLNAQTSIHQYPVHPPVQIQHIPKTKLPKSATDGQMTRINDNSQRNLQQNNKFASFQFLNFMSRKAPSNKPHSTAAALRDQLSRPTQPHISSNNSNSNTKEPTTKRRRKSLGLGPVRVVLKWHGSSPQSRSKRHPSSLGDKDKAAAARKKRVIVYKNGNPTSTRVVDATKMLGDPVQKIAPSSGQLLVQPTSSSPGPAPAPSSSPPAPAPQAPSVNITINPLESQTKMNPPHTSRRYSMQERASKRPALMSSFSEVHPPTSAIPQSSSSRRNRHSWCSPPLPDQIANDVQNDHARC